MTNTEIRAIVDIAISRHNSQARSYGYQSPERLLEEEIFCATGEWKSVPTVERPTVKEMMAAAKLAIRG
jgi:hypothetical protein